MMANRPTKRTTREFKASPRPRRQIGQAMTEFVLIIAMVVLPIVVVFNRLQGAIKTALNNLAGLLSGPGV